MNAYYNECDPHAAQWLRNLIDCGELPEGFVDERSIEDVSPADLGGFTQHHFFAGIGGWPLALRLAGWPDDRPVFTGSAPCQPFSLAGQGAGFADKRHLWPAFYSLIRERRPGTVFGEQVASPAGLQWLDLVSTDLEAEGYAVASVDLCAASVGAPHRRQRLYFVANSDIAGLERRALLPERSALLVAGARCVDDAAGARFIAKRGGKSPEPQSRKCLPRVGCVGNVCGERRQGVNPLRGYIPETARPSALDSWRDAAWLACSDGKARCVEPGTLPLVDGLSFRVGSGGPNEGRSREKELRGYGNAIAVPLAVEFVRAFLDTEISGEPERTSKPTTR